MKGYISQSADKNIYLDDTGAYIEHDAILDTLVDHEHADEIAELIGKPYRPENLHSNGDICDYWNPERLNLARVTHEVRNVNRADLCEQASFKGGQWEHLAESYQQFVKRMVRWRDGYNPEPTESDKVFKRKVAETELKMRRNRKFARAMRAKYDAL